MNKPINKTCPHCQRPFEARRKNQIYCTDECRHDANNTVAKQRYASVKQEAPKLVGLLQRVKKLEEYINSLTVVIQVAAPVNDVLTYGGRRYRRGKQAETRTLPVSLDRGGALLVPGNKIIYRSESSYRDNSYEYELDQ